MSPPQAAFSRLMSAPNCMLSWCCTGPRAAHTFHSIGLMNYWVGLILMSCCPCCTLMYTNGCTDMNVRLGGSKQNPLEAAICAWCCTCCLVAQDAQSLDYVTGMETE